MDYMTTVEAGEKWNLSKRRIAILCAEGRIPRAEKKGRIWLIPNNAQKPADARIKSGKYIKTTKDAPVINSAERRECK